MYLKHLFFISFIVINFADVKSDCDDFITCFGDYVHNVFGNNGGNSTKIDIIDISEYNNNDSVIQEGLNNDFNITKLENDLSDILANISSKIKEEIEEKAKTVSLSDTFITNNNNSDIFVKIFNIDNEFLPNADKKVPTAENSLLNIKPLVKLENNASVTKDNEENINIPINYEMITFKSFISNTQGDQTTPIHLNTETRINNQLPNDTIIAKPREPESVTINKEIVNLEYQSEIYVKHIDIDTTTSKNAYLPIVITTDANLPTTTKPNTYLPTQRSVVNSISTSGNTYLPTVRTTTIKNTSTTTVKNINALSTTKKDEFNIFDIKANEILDETYYEIQDDNATDYPIFDYIDLYKDTTNEIVNFKLTESYEEINKKSEENYVDSNIIEYSNAMGNNNNGLHVSLINF